MTRDERDTVGMRVQFTDALDRVEEALSGDGHLAESDVRAIASECRAYRLAGGDRFTEVKVTGKYVAHASTGSMEAEYERRFTADCYNDPLNEGLRHLEAMTNPEYQIEWTEVPTAMIRECIVTDWVPWNIE